MPKRMQNIRTSLNTIQKSIPEGSGGLLRASWAPGASQNCFQSPPGPQKNYMIAPGGAPERLPSDLSSKKTWLSWNGKRERLKSVEHCRRKKRRKSIGKEERPEHEHREEQQGKRSKSSVSRKPARLYNRGGALARALRARARPLGVGIIS